MAHVTVDTTEFEFSHGRKPRGHGCWVFFIGAQRHEFMVTDTFARARAEAVRQARETAASIVRVGP